MAKGESSKSGTNALSAVEQVLYNAVSDADILYQRDVETACPGYPVAQLQEAMNSLLRKSLLKMMKDSKGKPCFKAVNAKDARLLGALQGDESMVYTHIRNAGTEGIWTKTLKAKTNLHATVINRCLKQLEQRQLVKSVKNVKYPTRKTYMLYNLKPSVELTGGPWFSDNELDVGFIEGLLQAVYTFIEKKTFIGDNYQVWPTSRTDKYSTLSDIRRFIHTSGLTEVKLEEEHIKSLLDVLIYDGKIESLPGSGMGGWEEDDEESSDAGVRERSRDKGKRKKRKRVESDSDEDSEDDRRRRKKRAKRRSRSDDESDQSDEDERDHRRSTSSSKKRKRSSRSDESDASDSEEDSDASERRHRSRKKRRASRSPSRSRSASPVTFRDISPELSSLSNAVYRALRRETYGSGLTEVPCGLCEVFDFCAPKGPVNARDCKYYDEWLMPEKVDLRGRGSGKAANRENDGGEGQEQGEDEQGGAGEGWEEQAYNDEGYDGGGMEIGYEEDGYAQEEYEEEV